MSIHDELPSWRKPKACAEKSIAATAGHGQNAVRCWNKDLAWKPDGRRTRLKLRAAKRYIQHTRSASAVQSALNVG